MTTLGGRRTWFAATVLAVSGAAIVWGQGRNVVPEADASLAALTMEVRQLRLAVEGSARSQAQAQVLGVYLTMQQGRIDQATTRLNETRKELDALAVRSRELTNQLT